MKYLVTGASGFIGQNLCRHLSLKGHQVSGIDIARPRRFLGFEHFVHASITEVENYNHLSKGCDGVFHLAAIASVQETIKDPEGTADINVKATDKLFDWAAVNGLPVVYASSAAVYGDQENLPLSEDTAPLPLSPYAAHKISNENDAKRYGRDKGFKSYGLRFFNVYGPWQNPSSPYSGVISVFMECLLRNRPITVYGDGKQSRDFIFVEDTVQAMIAAMDNASDHAHVANVCTGHSVSLLELATLLFEITGREVPVLYENARPGDIRHSLGDNRVLTSAIGYKPCVSVSEGLEVLYSSLLQEKEGISKTIPS